MQGYADTNDQYNFHTVMKLVTSPLSKTFAPVRSKYGDMLQDKEKILGRCQKHFREIWIIGIQLIFML